METLNKETFSDSHVWEMVDKFKNEDLNIEAQSCPSVTPAFAKVLRNQSPNPLIKALCCPQKKSCFFLWKHLGFLLLRRPSYQSNRSSRFFATWLILDSEKNEFWWSWAHSDHSLWTAIVCACISCESWLILECATASAKVRSKVSFSGDKRNNWVVFENKFNMKF